MKVKALKRSRGASVQRETPLDLKREARNLNPQYHPMQRARELSRAVTSAKMQQMFRMPLVGNLGQGHGDAVVCSATSRAALAPLLSGAADGSVKLWDLPTRTQVANLNHAHGRAVTGVVFDKMGQHFYSCSDDGSCKRWTLHANADETDALKKDLDTKPTAIALTTTTTTHTPVATWTCGENFKDIDHSWVDADRFATASNSAVQLWSPERRQALQTHSPEQDFNSTDTIHVVRFHPVEAHLLGHCSHDRGVGLHDVRQKQALRKTTLRMRSNDLQWNPMEPMNFCVANEDYHVYQFDMRQLDRPLRMHQGHVAAVLSVSWSPTGREFVSGSYDKTVRIFSQNEHTAREVYHTKRMQRVHTVQYTQDANFIVTGSDDSNLRLWKARANQQLGQLTRREEKAINYRQALVQRYQHVPEVRKISKSRKLPKNIRNQTKQAVIQKEAADRKQQNRVKYDRQDKYKFISERQKVVVKETK